MYQLTLSHSVTLYASASALRSIVQHVQYSLSYTNPYLLHITTREMFSGSAHARISK
jgi:hypothetical protein